MSLISEFISDYGLSILYTILTAIISFVGVRIKTLYKKIVDNNLKKQVVEDTVKYVEQLYKNLNGKEKLEIAKKNILELLKDKGIYINELELNVLIESVCNNIKKIGGE